MPDVSHLEALFTEHLEQIQRITRFLCRRHGVTGDDSEECLSWVTLRLVENDYASLRKFRGESSILTYLTVVIAMLVRDFRIQRWGRWRPSAAALRQGPVAVRLETLIYRDGCSFNDAVQHMRNGGHAEMTERQLATILASLRPRTALRPHEVGDHSLAAQPAADHTDAPLLLAELQHERAQLEAALAEQLQHFTAEDRTILRLSLGEGLPVADIARGLHRPQRPLYRHLERLKRELRLRLERTGVTRERVAALLDEAQT
jgi:RNA polymerase sigma factor for flagellar operon FliA